MKVKKVNFESKLKFNNKNRKLISLPLSLWERKVNHQKSLVLLVRLPIRALPFPSFARPYYNVETTLKGNSNKLIQSFIMKIQH